jgi:bleomycin hydrolase
MNSIVKTKLREHALHLRKLAKSNVGTAGLTAAKDEMLREIHLILTLMLGPPPSPTREFSWEYYDQTKTARTLTRTPLGLAAELSAAGAGSGSDVARLFSLVHDPRHPAGTLLTVARLGNVVGGRGITYANVDMAVLKAACVAQLRAGIPVFFGCDVGKFSDNPSGVMDCDLLDFELGFNVRLGMSKAQRLETGESAMTHAMVLSGVHVLEGKSVRWRVQNSWGKDRGKDGWFVMSDRWMDEWVYQAVVDPK